ncbi:PIG-L family deacetylase [Gluconacetobacter diazotrophicus]|uniref:PIG-L family deacetylase n=1 Tax=Gluconacetobacter diazotrophicus TaxID=33996 RepID=A0A7W4I5F3_GLUDI|nr:PIG-L deacetylase family protein [Gluconacetobacter diazotrophicus]MBB2155780.1 PIG-L family deacetylase [Gluconacetobacter diazotrophicus]
MKAGRLQHAFRGLPVRKLADIVPGRALILAPHPDDESLGCGGLIAACCAAGRPPAVVIITDGAASHPASRAWPAPRLKRLREAEATEAARRLGLDAEWLTFLGLPDAAAPHDGPAFDAAPDRLADIARQQGCTTILAPWRHDPHCDHEATWKMGVALYRRLGIALLAYPVWGWTIAPDTELDCTEATGMRLDISAYRDAKRQAILAHRSQYGGLITDDPQGFQLPPDLLSAFETAFETFLMPDL